MRSLFLLAGGVTLALAATGVTHQSAVKAQGSGAENFRNACVLGLQVDYRADKDAAPSTANMAGVTQAQIDNACVCVTNAFNAAGNARSTIVNFGIQPTDYGMTFKLGRIGWYSVQGNYVNEAVDIENSREAFEEKYRGNPLNNLRNLFAPPPKERFVRIAQNCLQRNIDPKRYMW